MSLYAGIMSGTSLDGIDVAIVDIADDNSLNLVAAEVFPYSAQLKQQILTLITTGQSSVQSLGELDIALGQAYAEALNTLLKNHNIKAQQLLAVGCHGQTVFHAPNAAHPFSLQLGNGNVIAAKTGVKTVNDFRQADIEQGGQGAPLVPAFHHALFTHAEHHRVIVNIGGISNITTLPADQQQTVLGFDTGPGNVLLDSWIQLHQGKDFDKDGQWAAQGTVHQPLLDALLAEPYFSQAIPKSTGRELFNLSWLKQHIQATVPNITPIDVQATLLALTAQSISDAIQAYAADSKAVYICGGGARNTQLMQSLASLMPHRSVETTEALGLHPDWVEACAFAWLAKQRIENNTGNLPAVTGANRACVLGAVYEAVSD
jgi:anhydro-N-acetylmuramic acid kinase